MQTLQMASHLMPKTKDGQKYVTIRKGFRNIALGPLRIENAEDADDAIDVEVFSAFCVPFNEIPEHIIHDDGGESHEHMLKTMQSFYPDMQMDSESTVVFWREG